MSGIKVFVGYNFVMQLKFFSITKPQQGQNDHIPTVNVHMQME